MHFMTLNFVSVQAKIRTFNSEAIYRTAFTTIQTGRNWDKNIYFQSASPDRGFEPSTVQSMQRKKWTFPRVCYSSRFSLEQKARTWYDTVIKNRLSRWWTRPQVTKELMAAAVIEKVSTTEPSAAVKRKLCLTACTSWVSPNLPNVQQSFKPNTAWGLNSRPVPMVLLFKCG